MVKKTGVFLFIGLVLFITGCNQRATTVTTEFVPAPEDITMIVKPIDSRIYMGGVVTLLPRFYAVQPDGSRGLVSVKLTNVQFFVDDKLVFQETVSNFWTKYNFLPYGNGSHSFQTIAVTADGYRYSLVTNIIVSNVPVVFRAHLREPLGTDRRLYLAGSSPALGIRGEEFNPRGFQFKKVNSLTYEATVTLGIMENIKYEVTCGNWAVKAYDSNNNYIQGTEKITHAGQVIDINIDNFGVTNGVVNATGFVVGFTGTGSELTVNYVHPDTNEVKLYWSYDGGEFYPATARPSQYCQFKIPAQYAKTLKFFFSNKLSKTNTFDIPYNNVPFQFVAVGDTHGLASSIVKRIASSESPAFVVHMGDLVYEGFKAGDWNNFINNTRPILSKFLFQPTAGNHDSESPFWAWTTGKPWWYSFTWANCYFIAVDNSAPFDPGSTQYKWLENELKNARYHPFVIVYMHYPPYSARRHYGDIPSQTILVPLFEKYGVDVVLSGHNHGYEVSYPILQGNPDPEGIVYVTSGGGGGYLYDSLENPEWRRMEAKKFHYLRASVSEKEILFEAVDENGNVFDSFKIAP